MTTAAANLSLSLGIDLGGTKLEALLLTAQGQEHWRRRWASPQGDYRATVAALAQAVAEARQAAGGAPFTVGMGTPGTVMADGRMKNCNSAWLNGQPLPADVEAAIGQPVRMANDANCLALSEATDGAAAGADVVFAVILGTGCGGGISVGGRLLTGPNGLAGEWGHNPLPWGAEDEATGPDPAWRCYCGRTGCVETLVSGPGLARDHAAPHGGGLDAVAIAAAAAAGDAACQETLRLHSHRLARSLASVINLLDPDVIVLAGGLSAMKHLYTELPQRWSHWAMSAGNESPPKTKLVQARFGDSSGVRGAAWLRRGVAG